MLVPHDVFSTLLAVKPDAVRLLAKTITERLKIRQQDEDAQSRVDDAWRNVSDPYGLNLTATTPMKILVLNAGSGL